MKLNGINCRLPREGLRPAVNQLMGNRLLARGGLRLSTLIYFDFNSRDDFFAVFLSQQPKKFSMRKKKIKRNNVNRRRRGR